MEGFSAPFCAAIPFLSWRIAVRKSSFRARREPTLRDLITMIQRMRRRIDVLEEKWRIHNTPRRIDTIYVEQENSFHQEVSILPLSSLTPVYDESIYDDHIPNMVNSSMTENDDVLASFESDIDRVLPPPVEDLLEIIRSGIPYVKSLGDKLSVELDQDASSVEELLLHNSEINQSQLSAQAVEIHNSSTAIPEGPVIDSCATYTHNSWESLIIHSASTGEVVFDMVIEDLLNDLHIPHVHQFWRNYIKCQVASPRRILKNFLSWIRVRKKKITVNSLSSLRHATDEIDVSPTRGE